LAVLEDYEVTLKPELVSPAPERRIVRLELQHAIAAIERAWLIARDSKLITEPDLTRLLEAARATLDLMKGPSDVAR
jgi:hypothetical protein